MPVTKIPLPMFSTEIDLPERDRYPLIELLNERLADTADLYSQIKQAHWNVKGLNFFQLHELFDQLAGEIFPFIDMIAERATALGGLAMGTVRMAAARSTLPEYPLEISDGPDHVEALSTVLADFGKKVRADIDVTDGLGDKDTADLLTGVSRSIDKLLWFVEAHIQS